MSNYFSISEIVDGGGNFINAYIDNDEVDKIALKVLEYDKPNHILPFAAIYNNDEVLLKYNFSNIEKIEMIDENMSCKNFIEILSKLCNLLCNCQYWFLHSNNFLFDKRYVFYNSNERQLQLIYLPVKNIEDKMSLKDLVLYLIEKVDIKKGDKFKISLLQEMVKPNFNSYKLQKFLKTQQNISQKEEASDNNMKKEPKKEKNKKKSFLSWLFQTDPIAVNESINAYKESAQEIKKYYLHLKKNDTRFRLSKSIPINFLDDTFLVGRSIKDEEQSLLKYSFSKQIKEIDPLHLKFVKKGKKIYLVDLESNLGTYINGNKINPRKSVEVVSGDSIALSPKIVYVLKVND